MRTIETVVYTFDELSEKAQATAIDNLRDINVDDPDWADEVINENIAKLQGIGFTDVEIFYSGFSSQGDGACFTSGWANVDQVLAAFGATEAQKQLAKSSGLEFKIVRTSHRYSHELCVAVECGLCTGELASMVNDVQDWARSKMQDIYRHLESEYYDRVSDEAVKETIIANEWEFTEDGKMI